MNFKRLVALLPCHSLEDLSLDRDPAEADQLLAAWTALWHPALIASAGELPSWARAEGPPEDPAGYLVTIPRSSQPLVPAEWPEQARRAGACVLQDLSGRAEFVRAALTGLGAGGAAVDPELAADFMALGFGYLQIELLTRQLRYMSNLDESALQTRTLDAAAAALRGDRDTAVSQLHSAMDVLHEAREYFYPVEAHLLDLTVVTPTMIGAELRSELARPRPTNLLLTGETLAEIARREPETLAAIAQAWDEKRASLIAGEFHELPLPLLTPEAIAASIARGLAVFRQYLGREPVLFGRRRFGLTPILPTILGRFGFSGVLHFTLDDGQFPTGNQSRARWEALDGTTVEALARVPVDANRSDTFFRLPQKFGDILDLDHAATVVFAHWPGRASPWYEDVQRIAAHGRVLGNFATLSDYLSNTGYSSQVTKHEADAYHSPYLRQAVATGQLDPISRYVRYYARTATLQAWQTLWTLTTLLSAQAAETSPGTAWASELEDSLEGVVDPTLDARLQAAWEVEARRFSQLIAPPQSAGETPQSAGEKGQLLVNPCDFSRRMETEVPGVAEPAASREAAQLAEVTRGPRLASVEVPGLGFAWVAPEATTMDSPQATSSRGRWLKKKPPPPMAEGTVLRNEFFQVTLSPITGAIESIYVYGVHGNHISQQIALRLPDAGASAPRHTAQAYSIMAADELRVVSPGPTMGEIVCRGRLVDRQAGRLAGFTQTTRVRRGSRVLEIEIQLEPGHLPEGDPWKSYYAARFAWNDETAKLYRSVNMMSRQTTATHLEAPHFVEICWGASRAAILTGGLPFHRRAGPRMLDTLLIARGERARTFRLGIALESPHPLSAALDFMSPHCVVTGVDEPVLKSGWLFHLDARNVVATHWEPIVTAGQVEGFRVRLLETEGRRAALGLRSFRRVGSARRLDRPPVDLPIEGDCVRVEIHPAQWIEVECRYSA
jgi:alpha-mannosidase